MSQGKRPFVKNVLKPQGMLRILFGFPAHDAEKSNTTKTGCKMCECDVCRGKQWEDKPSPSPEARVDWGKEARKIALKINNRCSCVPTYSSNEECDCEHCVERYLIQQEIANALSAAFEKGREAR